MKHFSFSQSILKILLSALSLILSVSRRYSSENVPWGWGNLLSTSSLHDVVHKLLSGINRHFVAAAGISTADTRDSSRGLWMGVPSPLLPLSVSLSPSLKGPWATAITWRASREKKSNLNRKNDAHWIKIKVHLLILFLSLLVVHLCGEATLDAM